MTRMCDWFYEHLGVSIVLLLLLVVGLIVLMGIVIALDDCQHRAPSFWAGKVFILGECLDRGRS